MATKSKKSVTGNSPTVKTIKLKMKHPVKLIEIAFWWNIVFYSIIVVTMFYQNDYLDGVIISIMTVEIIVLIRFIIILLGGGKGAE